MSVQQKPQSRRTSHSLSSFAGETMSPKISTESFIDPIQADRSWTDDGGITSATGVPWRVMQIGFLVVRTRSSTARHFALNSEIAISSIVPPVVIIIDHSHNNGQCPTLTNCRTFSPQERSLVLLCVRSASSASLRYPLICTSLSLFLAPLLLKPVPSLPRRRKLRLRSWRIRPRLLLQLQKQRQIANRRRLQNLDRLLPINRPVIRWQVLILLPMVVVNVCAHHQILERSKSLFHALLLGSVRQMRMPDIKIESQPRQPRFVIKRPQIRRIAHLARSVLHTDRHTHMLRVQNQMLQRAKRRVPFPRVCRLSRAAHVENHAWKR